MQQIVPVLMAGGGGTRLWPLSRDTRPKQFWPLVHAKQTLFQDTLLRFADSTRYAAPIILTHDDYRFIAQDQCDAVHLKPQAIGLETARRDTLVVAALAALMVTPDDFVLLAAADHIIAKETDFHTYVQTALQAAQAGYIVTFGITPTNPETGYGYIEQGDAIADSDVLKVKRFVEKPNVQTAQTYLDSGHYVWNSGIFLAQAKTIIAELEKHAPKTLQAAKTCLANAEKDLGFTRFNAEDLDQAPKISIDYGLMEKTDKAAVLPVSIGWSDIGSWQALWQELPKDVQGNVTSPQVAIHNCHNTYVRGSYKPIIAVGLREIAVVDTADALLVMDLAESQNLKTALGHAPESIVQHSNTVNKVWGQMTTLHQSSERIRKVTLNPQHFISYQSHARRTEQWNIISGQGIVVINDVPQTVSAGSSINIPPHTKHFVKNTDTTPLVLIELQTGDFMDETDVIRYLQPD